MKSSQFKLLIIVISQFMCTSLWFAGNSVINNLVTDFDLENSALGHIASSVQFGFIIGTLIFAIFAIADRFSPSKVFCFSALFGALFNLGIIWEENTLFSILALRFLTGFFLAGIYPVGMKIASDYFEKGLGKSLGFLVGALVLGTAFPHLLKEMTLALPWNFVFIGTSFLAVFGGILVLLLVPDGRFRKPSQKTDFSVIFKVFQHQKFRSSAFGYFGHMWELYAFWTFIPVILKTYSLNFQTSFNIPLLSFFIIATGSLSCIFGGYMSEKIGAKRMAFIFLFLSCVCCLISPFVFAVESEIMLIIFLAFWGMVVVADSPLFSTLVAQSAPAEIKGTSLTIVNCIGFAITIISIQFINEIRLVMDSNSIYIVLALGPIFGLISLIKRSNLSN